MCCLYLLRDIVLLPGCHSCVPLYTGTNTLTVLYTTLLKEVQTIPFKFKISRFKPTCVSLAPRSICGKPVWMNLVNTNHPRCCDTSQQAPAEKAPHVICKISDGNRLVRLKVSTYPSSPIDSSRAFFFFTSCQTWIIMTHPELPPPPSYLPLCMPNYVHTWQ